MGEMYRQFAITIAVSVIISGFVALTLTPALCALMLKKGKYEGVLGRFDSWFQSVTLRYTRSVRFMLRHTLLAVGIIVSLLVATWGLSRAIPSALAPEEDQGWLVALTILPPAASLQRTDNAVQQLVRGMSQHPAIGSSVAFAGLDPLTFGLRTNTAYTLFQLKDWEERKELELSAQGVVGAIFEVGAGIRDALTIGINPPADLRHQRNARLRRLHSISRGQRLFRTRNGNPKIAAGGG